MFDTPSTERKARHVRIGDCIRWAGQWAWVVRVEPTIMPRSIHHGGGYWFTIATLAGGERRVHYYGNESVTVKL